MGRSADRCHAGDSSPLRRHEVSGSLEPVKTFPIEARELLGVQHGLISLEQCRGIELDDAHVKALVRSGRWERVAPAVYTSPGHHQTWNRSLWLAHLHAGPDSVVSHQSAGRLHGYTQVQAGIVSLMGSSNCRHGPAETRWHRGDDLLPAHVTRIGGLPVTTPLRTIFDLASVMHIASLRDLVRDEITLHQLDVAELGAVMDSLRRRGKPGVAKLARVLDDLGPGEGLSRSQLERLLDEVISGSGLPTPAVEYPLPGRGAATGFVDRCWPEARMIVEADGRRWHTRRTQMGLDATRSIEAQAAGFETTRLLWEHLESDADNTARLLRTIYEQRLDLVGRQTS